MNNLALSPETVGHLLLAALFCFTVATGLVFKVASHKIDHRTAPAFMCLWVLAGLGLTFPLYGDLWYAGWQGLIEQPWLALLMLAKGGLLWLLFSQKQHLNKMSLSARNYTSPVAIGLMVFTNAAFGEQLATAELVAAMGLCALGLLFAFKGHLQDLPAQGKTLFGAAVLLTVACGTLDHILLTHLNWYVLLVVTNIILLAVVLLQRGGFGRLRESLTAPLAIAAGALFATTELVKFYQTVSYSPVTVVVTVQSATIPVLLILSALIWKERTWREQGLWGLLALALILPVILT